jgi:hypothetical protein
VARTTQDSGDLQEPGRLEATRRGRIGRSRFTQLTLVSARKRVLTIVVWMFLRVRRQLRSRSARWLLYPVLAVLMIVSVGAGYETVHESRDARAYPAPGQLIDVGGHRLHLHCTGSGSPTVVLEPGLGEASWGMAWIAPAVARDTRFVCTTAWVEAGATPPTVCGTPSNGRRPPHIARSRPHSWALCAGRSLVRRSLRPNLRRHLPRSG